MSTFVNIRLQLVLVTALLLTGCGGSSGGTTCACPAQLPAATPTFSPAAGTFSSTQTVTISDSTTGATIYYTTDGTAPTSGSTLYSAPVAVTASETIEAIATASGYTQSAVAKAAYTITLTPPQAAAPTISTSTGDGVQNGAVIVTLASTTSGATIYYTIDGTTPTTSSTQYIAPFLVASNLTINAIATASGDTNSNVTTQAFTANIASGTLVWSDEFSNSTTTNAQPNPQTWTYDTGYQCCGNDEQETYCAWGSTTSPCNPANPNAFIAPGGGLNVVAESPSAGVYTSGRLKSQGLFSFQYGRIEAQMTLPESQAMWPAFWLLGNSISTISWPACGELDVMEHIDGNNTPFGGPGNGAPPGYDWIAGSVHGGASGSAEESESQQYTTSGFTAAATHTYGMIWTKGEIQYYVDSPTTGIYATYKSTDSAWTPTAWPFDAGPEFIILNLAVGGDWPGDVNSSTVLPSTMQVQYVRIYAN